MDEIVQTLWTLSKVELIQDVDHVIGKELSKLFFLIDQNPTTISEDFEDLLLKLIVLNKSQISLTNSHLIASCLIKFYKNQKSPNFWKIIPLLSNEIKQFKKPSIYILGFISKNLCDGFKSQLHTPIRILLTANDESLFPVILQCFRRIIKGTGTFLNSQIPQIFSFIFASSSSTNENIRIEAVKSIPTLFRHAKISIKKLIPIIGQIMTSKTPELQFHTAKAYSKLLFYGLQIENEEENQKSHEFLFGSHDKTKNDPFGFIIKSILQFVQNEQNAETLSISFQLLFRYFEPIELVQKLKTFSKLLLSLSSFRLPAPTLIYLSRSIVFGITSVIGSTGGNSICHQLIEIINNDKENNLQFELKSFIALNILISFDASLKTITAAAKLFYPLLSSEQKFIQKSCIAFFSMLGRKEPALGKIFLETFCSYLLTIEDNRCHDIEGFSKATAAIVVSNHLSDDLIDQLKRVIVLFLNSNDIKISMAFLLLSSLLHQKKGYDLIPNSFNYTQSFLKNLSKKKNDKYLRKTIKYISLYFIEILENPPKLLNKLMPTILAFISVISMNLSILSKSGQCIFLRLARSYFEISSEHNTKIIHSMVKSIISLFRFSFCHPFCESIQLIDDELNSITSANICHKLYNFEVPFNAQNIKTFSIIDLFKLSQKNFYLNELPFWLSKSSPELLRELIPPLFEFKKLPVVNIIINLLLIQKFLCSDLPIDLSKTFYDKLLCLEFEFINQHQIQFVLAETISLWLQFHSSENFEILPTFFNTKNPFFCGYLIYFLSNVLNEDLRFQCLIFLFQQIRNSDHPLFLFSLNSLLTSFTDKVDIICDFLESLSFTNILNHRAAFLDHFTKCMVKIGDRLNSEQTTTIARNLLFNSPRNSTFSKLCGLKIVSSSGLEIPIDKTIVHLTTPHSILINIFSSPRIFTPTIDDIPLLFMTLQQSTKNNDCVIVNNCIYNIFNKNKWNVQQWTSYVKQIVIIGSVPPYERQGDIRITPTETVLITAINISVLLVRQIRKKMELDCVDDIVSIAFNAIHMSNKRIDLHCYSILTSVLVNFSNVRNMEGCFLDLYFSQFHPIFCHALDGSHDIKSISEYVIAYYRYVENHRQSLLTEICDVMINGLRKIEVTTDNLSDFCRIASLLTTDEFDGQFNLFLKNVLTQKRKLSELKSELPNFVSKINHFPQRIVLGLVLSELSVNCSSVNLNAINQFDCIIEDQEAVEFVLKTVSNSKLPEIERQEFCRLKQELNNSNEKQVFTLKDHLFENEIEQNSFWRVPMKKTSCINKFLLKITDNKSIKNNEIILELALKEPICFGAICNLAIGCKELIQHNIERISTILWDCGEYNEIIASFLILFDRIDLNEIDSIILKVINNTKIPIDIKFDLLKMALSKLNGYEFQSITEIVTFLSDSEILFPTGLNFIGDLLVSSKTQLSAIYLLNSELLKILATSSISSSGIRYLPRILHFFNLVLKVVKPLVSEIDFESLSLLATRIVFVSLAQASNVKDRNAVVVPCCLIIKQVDTNIVKSVFVQSRLKSKSIQAVTPPKQAVEIQLLTFADIKYRKSSPGGWQNLDEDDA